MSIPPLRGKALCEQAAGLSVPELAERLGVPPAQVWSLVRDGRLPRPIGLDGRSPRFPKLTSLPDQPEQPPRPLPPAAATPRVPKVASPAPVTPPRPLFERAAEVLEQLLLQGSGQATLVDGNLRLFIDLGTPKRSQLSLPGLELTQNESDVLSVLAETGQRLSGARLHAELERRGVVMGFITVKRACLRFVRLGLVTNSKTGARGYRLVEGAPGRPLALQAV